MPQRPNAAKADMLRASFAGGSWLPLTREYMGAPLHLSWWKGLWLSWRITSSTLLTCAALNSPGIISRAADTSRCPCSMAKSWSFLRWTRPVRRLPLACGRLSHPSASASASQQASEGGKEHGGTAPAAVCVAQPCSSQAERAPLQPLPPTCSQAFMIAMAASCISASLAALSGLASAPGLDA